MNICVSNFCILRYVLHQLLFCSYWPLFADGLGIIFFKAKIDTYLNKIFIWKFDMTISYFDFRKYYYCIIVCIVYTLIYIVLVRRQKLNHFDFLDSILVIRSSAQAAVSTGTLSLLNGSKRTDFYHIFIKSLRLWFLF